MVTRESQITTQIVLNNQPNSNTTEMKQKTKTWKIHKTEPIIRDLYITILVTFEQSERSNWSTTKYEPSDKIVARSNGGRNRNRNPKSFVLNRNAKNAAAVRWISLWSNNFGNIRTVRLKSHKVMEEAQAHDRKSSSPSPNTSSSFSSSPTNRRFGPTKHHWMSFFVITFEYF